MPQSQNLLQRARTKLARLISGRPAAALRRFEGARVDRLTADWMATRDSINQELRADLDRLRARGRDLAKNNDYAAKFVGMCKNNIVGPEGFMLQARTEFRSGQPDEMDNAAIEAAFSRWSAACDITGSMSLKDVCETLVGGLPSDGEFLVRFVRGAEAGNPFNFALQLVDVDRIDTTYHTQLKNGNRVVMGVERDVFGRPQALYLFDGHPNDGEASNRNRTRVPVSELLHRFKTEVPGQVRGIPWMAPGMLSLHHLGGFKLAALLAAEHGANHYGFFVTEDGRPAFDEKDGETKQTITTSQPGVYDTLPSGTTFVPNESKYPNEVFGPFVKVTLQRIASGWRVAYHSLANDLEGVSFSSIRSGTLEERDRWAADQAWFINAFLEPLYAEWLRMALLSGAIISANGTPLPASKIDKFRAHQWQGRRWDWVDPRNDMEAKILGVKAGLLAPQDIAAQMGRDFNDTMAKIAQAQQMAAALGITLPAYEDQTANPQATAQTEQAVDQMAKAFEAIFAGTRLGSEQLGALLDTVRTLAAREHKTEVHVAPAAVTVPTEVHNHVAPAAATVEVKNDVHVPERSVNLEAVISTPAPVSETTTIERDAAHEAVRTTKTYTYQEPTP